MIFTEKLEKNEIFSAGGAGGAGAGSKNHFLAGVGAGAGWAGGQPGIFDLLLPPASRRRWQAWLRALKIVILKIY